MTPVLVAAALLAVLLAACGGGVAPLPTSKYELTVAFNTSVRQADIEEAEAVLRAYDPDLEFLVQESFPPVGRAFLVTREPAFCRTIESELEAEAYIEDVDCRSGR